jgi:putative ATP-dependent endonuclease of the OLD family
MRLESFGVQGFRSLADVAVIPVRQPTILTGENDGGKSSALEALAFLLSGPAPAREDYSFKWGGEDSQGAAELPRVGEIVVTGEFSLSQSEQKVLSLPARISLRRKVANAHVPVFEIYVETPEDEALRGIEEMRIQDLRTLASTRGVEPEGKRTESEAWRRPLRELAVAGPQIFDWISASRDVTDRLPVFLLFSSRDEPDPEAQVRSVLHAAYKRLLDDTELVRPVRELEEAIKGRLRVEAEQLCAHIRERVPELTSISAIPTVSFKDGFSSVQLRALKDSEDVGLQQAGAGRQRRISLAVWEWVSMPRGNDDQIPPDLVVAYDEPDTHLDYGKQRELVDLIHAQCREPRVRMIVATHSLNLIDRVDISDVVQLRLDETKRTSAERLIDGSHEGVDQYLSQLSAAMGLRTSVMLHERCFLAVEGQTEEQTFPHLFRLVTGKPMQSAGIALLCGGGNDGALQVTQFLIKHNRAVVFIVDKDSAGKKVFSLEKLHAYGVKDEQIHFVGAPNELEELYTDQQWADTANGEWPRTDGRSWTVDDVGVLRVGGKFSDSLKKALWEEAKIGPSSKQEMNMKLVHRLKTADEVPEQLREKFQAVARLASGDREC